MFWLLLWPLQVSPLLPSMALYLQMTSSKFPETPGRKDFLVVQQIRLCPALKAVRGQSLVGQLRSRVPRGQKSET